METGKVNSKTENGIATVTYFHPQSNSLPGELLRTLADEITKAGNDPAAKVIILKSEGEKAFCAGASFDELISIPFMSWPCRGRHCVSGMFPRPES